MKTFATRRWLAIVLTILAGAVIAAGLRWRSPILTETTYVSGWMLLAMMLFLALYNLRKKLPYPPLVSSSLWLQLHVYVGFLSIVLFPVHIGLRLPNGPFEVTLTLLFVAVAGSGVVGLVLSRAIPAQLTVRGEEEVLFERIPQYRRHLHEQAEQIVMEAVQEDDARTLADFYQDRLVHFFRGPQHLVHHLLQSDQPRARLLRELQSLGRYFNEREKEVAIEIEELINAKDSLDYHTVMQGTLKGWLFVHIPLTYVLLVFVAVHAVVVHTFVGVEF